jgi:pimeloyl-ACP methyl ester carboxylesterase
VDGVREVRVRSTDGTEVAVQEIGAGPPVVIMPGSLAPGWVYSPLAALLAPDHRVLTIDRRGYGKTPVGPRGTELAAHAEDLRAVLDELAEPTVVFGHSFGAVAAMVTATTDARWIDRLVLYEPPVAKLGAAMMPVLAECSALLAADRLVDAMVVALGVTGWSRLDDDRSVRKLAGRLVRLGLVTGLRTDMACVAGLDRPDPAWAGITVPVCLLGGSDSGPDFHHGLDLVAELLPAADRHLLLGQSHFPTGFKQIAPHLGWHRH